MSTTTTSENGTTTNGDGAPKNRVRAALSAGTTFTRLYALASRAAERKGFTLKRQTEEGAFMLKFDGYPSALTAGAVAKLAENGGKLAGTVVVGAATGRFTGVVLGPTASEMVAEMVAE
jgi:hypothetical protein